MALLGAVVPVIDWAGYCPLTPAKQLVWEERGNELNKAILYLINSKNEHAKKDLCLAYSQGNLTAYLTIIEGTARYLSTQYPNNKPANQRDDKKGDKRKGDDPKLEDKDNNRGGTVGTHVEDTTASEEFTAASGGTSISAHVLETNVQLSHPSLTVEESLGAHPMNDDDFWGGPNPGDMSIDTENSKEMMTGSLITELHTHKCEELAPPELLNVVPNEPQAYNSAQNYQLDSLNKSKDSNILSKTNNTAHTKGIDILSQENQDYYNQNDQQFIACKYDGGLE